MGRRRVDPDEKIKDHFVAVTYTMIDHVAYRKLRGTAVKVLILCMRKVKTHHPFRRYDFQFSLTFAEAKKQGIPGASFDRAIVQLIELGFIDCVTRGGIGKDGKSPTYYRLSKRWLEFGKANFVKRWRGYCESVHGRERDSSK